MKKILVSILFISSGQMHTAQFARKAASATGRFAWAPSVAIGTFSAGIFFTIANYYVNNIFNIPLNTNDLDPDFVKTVEQEAAKRGLKNVGITYVHFDLGMPNMGAIGNANKSLIRVYYGYGLSHQEKNILLDLKKEISFYTESLRDGITPLGRSLDPITRQEYERRLMKLTDHINNILSSQLSLDQILFLIGHELSHIQANDTRSFVVVNTIQEILPFISWRAARLSGGGRLISLGAAGLGHLIGVFANSLFRKSREYKADYNASNDPKILEAGAQMMDKAAKSKQLIKQRLLENFKKFRSGSKLSEKEKGEMLRDINSLLLRTIQHPDPAKRAERLRARAQELREQKLDSIKK